MAIVESETFDGMHNQLGGKVLRTLPSGTIVLAKMPAEQQFKDKGGRMKRDLRMMGYGECGRMSRLLADTLGVGYVQRERYISAANAFMEENATTFCTVTMDGEGMLLFDYKFDLLQVSRGDAAKPKTAVTYDFEARKIAVEQTAEPDPSSKRNPDDRVYACMFDTVNFESELMSLRVRGEGGSSSFAIPAEWDAENTVVYTFAVFANNQRASPPNYYHHVTEAEVAAIAERDRVAREAEQRRQEEEAAEEAVVKEKIEKAARVKLGKSDLRKAKEKARSRGVQNVTLGQINADIQRILTEEEEREKKRKQEQES